ncbi:MAG TPA: exodeoxyribonuclease VII small subunit [Anaerolineaceae bacterium]|jgi:exodeoxyribonuclease VII small subunit|nr:exodeoxyribonuclease VII small subunit [Chloroflexota bacterium]HNS07703.1 exodeoxyribonuclease VII small subunit [Anaerolineaceae bacterium]HNW14598.1 exodeoxyribonuclease VII small subunit [Anaerolineaceae bacterium]HOE02522.1 exodeoxyribonuclease VII small subunit [Anaerolineaceae bacterium]HOQ69150.1 exodeoxyribonuclease VII small subunit [Anaerolineaceae bacterium]
MVKSASTLSDLSYEQAFSELETIVAALESEQKPLDEALQLYERGQLLVQYCAALLDQADLRIQQLNPNKETTEDAA